MLQNNIKEVEDKKCQTDISEDYEKYENLKKEVYSLRCILSNSVMICTSLVVCIVSVVKSQDTIKWEKLPT